MKVIIFEGTAKIENKGFQTCESGDQKRNFRNICPALKNNSVYKKIKNVTTADSIRLRRFQTI